MRLSSFGEPLLPTYSNGVHETNGSGSGELKNERACCCCSNFWKTKIGQNVYYYFIKPGYAVAASIPSIMIAQSAVGPGHPKEISVGASAMSNIFLNGVNDLQAVRENWDGAKARLANRCVHGLTLAACGVSVGVCALSLGMLTSESAESDLGKWSFFFLGLAAALLQRANGTLGFIAKVPVCSSFIPKKRLDQLIFGLDTVFSAAHFVVGIPIWLDMYTSKSYLGLNKLMAFFGSEDFICEIVTYTIDEKNKVTVDGCNITPEWFAFFAYCSLMHLIFFSWAARRPLQNFLNFIESLQKMTSKNWKTWILFALFGGGIAVGSHYSAYGLINAYLKSRYVDPAGLNDNRFIIFAYSRKMCEILADIFFTFVNANSIYITVPVALPKLCEFLKSIGHKQNVDNRYQQLKLEQGNRINYISRPTPPHPSNNSCGFFNKFFGFCRFVRQTCCGSSEAEKGIQLRKIDSGFHTDSISENNYDLFTP